MEKYTVVVIGGGATGTGILRDLAMRGIKALLIEQQDLAHGTSSRFHGLLHSGGRYAVKDEDSAKECVAENAILRTVAKYCVEAREGFFVRSSQDGAEYEQQWLNACHQTGVLVAPLTTAEAIRLEPRLAPDIQAAYRVPDAAVDGFRLVWQNAWSAQRYGGVVRTYTKVVGIEQRNGQVIGIVVRNTVTGIHERIACDMIVNATGSWVGQVAALVGITVPVQPDKGALIAFNHRFTSRVINRLRVPGDADIFVPHGSITIFGTSSVATDRPDDFTVTREEILRQLEEGMALFRDIYDYRILRVFAGTRPLYSSDGTGRGASRTFSILDHKETDNLTGMITIVGGKLTTYRLMAEKTVDLVCEHLGIKAICLTAQEPLIPEVSVKTRARASQYLPAFAVERAAARLGPKLEQMLDHIEENDAKKQLVCECEMVTLAEIEIAATINSSLDDIRRKTRMGMGTCQGAFCALRGAGTMVTNDLHQDRSGQDLLTEFLESRWGGIRPVLWGAQLREAELTRAIYGATLNIDGVMADANE